MKFWYHLLAGLSLLMIAAGCGDDSGTDPDPEHAEVLFFHAAPAGASVKLLIDATAVITDRAFSIVHDDYVTVDAGTHEVKIAPMDGSNALVGRSLTFTKDAHYTLFAVNDTNGVFDLLLFRDDLTHPAAGKAHIRIANLIPDAPALKLAIPQSGTGPIFNDVDFKDNTESFAAINAGSATFRVQNAGAGGGGGGGGGGSQGIIDDLSITLEDGVIYTIALVGRLSDSSATAVVIRHEHE